MFPRPAGQGKPYCDYNADLPGYLHSNSHDLQVFVAKYLDNASRLRRKALSRVEAGGCLATFTCSAKLGSVDFLALLRSASRECRRSFSVLRELAAGPDHPVASGLPESRYLAGLLVRVNS